MDVGVHTRTSRRAMREILGLMVSIPGVLIMHFLPFLVLCFLITVPLYPIAMVMEIVKKK